MWKYYRNPYNYTWIIKCPGHPMLFAATEYSAKYMTELFNNRDKDRNSEVLNLTLLLLLKQNELLEEKASSYEYMWHMESCYSENCKVCNWEDDEEE